jgi:thiol-disulfide isomerase/thioredoxin
MEEPLRPGREAPSIPGATSGSGPRAVVFLKVTCPTCQLAAPVAERLHQSFPDRVLAVGQDPREKLDQFAQELGTTFPTVPDEEPYPASEAYGIRTVPTLFVIDDGTVVDVVESWDRDGWNRAAAKLGALTATSAESLSWEGDGLPPFRPG